jgi:hypothetical protein
MDKEMMNMMDTVTKSLDLLVQTQRSTQEFMKSQLDVNKMLIERITRLEAKTNVIKASEPIAVNEIFDNMINRFKNEEKKCQEKTKPTNPNFDLSPVEKACATLSIALEPYIEDQTAEEYLRLRVERNRVQRAMSLLLETLEADDKISYDKIIDALLDGWDYEEDSK